MIILVFLICLSQLMGISDGRIFNFGRSNWGSLGSPVGLVNEEDLPKPQWFTQRLDHFNPSETREWKQRYFVNDTFFNPKSPGPIFLMIGGEGPLDARWMLKGHWIEMAREAKALCFMPEHRFYGESRPTKDLSVKSLQYLTPDQALADLAFFIDQMNEKYKLDPNVSLWVAFGGSYPGSLAAWLRLKYPQLVSIAISTSGPLLAKINFQEYFTVVVNSLREKTQSESCVDQLKAAHKQIENLIESNSGEIEKQFKLCTPLKSATLNDKKTLFSNIASYFADLVQYNEDNRFTRDKKYRNMTINTVCNLITDSSTKRPAYLRLAAFSNMMLEEAKESCLDYSYQNMIDELRNTSFGPSSEGGRQWFYQTCSQFGFFQTSSAEPEVFGDYFNLSYYLQQCVDVFGKKYNEKFISDRAYWSNVNYGALDIPITRVVFVHGSVDPWHALGITVTREQNAPVVYIRGTAHCANMYPPSPADSEELREARLEIKQYLFGWLGLY